MDESSGEGLSDHERDAILRHYRAAGPLLTQYFGGTPVIEVAYPLGLGGKAVLSEAGGGGADGGRDGLGCRE
jgi:hypothetical protein